jgi:hypothetical protein
MSLEDWKTMTVVFLQFNRSTVIVFQSSSDINHCFGCSAAFI